MSNKTLTLTFPHVGPTGDLYRVDNISGSTQFHPGQLMTKSEVDDVIQYKSSWKVTMKRNTDPK